MILHLTFVSVMHVFLIVFLCRVRCLFLLLARPLSCVLCRVAVVLTFCCLCCLCLICVSLIGGACIRGAYWTEQCGVIGHPGVGWGEGGIERGYSACYMYQVASLLGTPVQSNPINLQ